jgi:3-hydroxy-9,10-secoandrosta-1,3,5(10)-triene-9,17-dione monooxygenase
MTARQSAELIQTAAALAPGIRSRARETEQMRRPHPDSIDELIASGLLKMCSPRRWGGDEADFLTLVEVVETIAGACMSTGWIASFYIGHCLALAKFPLRAQEEALGERGFALAPAASAPNLSARRTGQGYVLSGRAIWGSGIMDADWVILTGMVEGEGVLNFLIPAADVEIHDVWQFAGMSGTGSNDYSVQDIFVPAHRTISALEWMTGPTEGSMLHDNPVFSAPFLAIACAQIAGVFSGGLTGMAEGFRTIVERRVRNFSGAITKDQPQAHIELGEALFDARIARDLARAQARSTEGLIARGKPTLDDRIYLKSHVAFLSQHCREAANRIIAKSGASNFQLDSIVQRHFRDINMLSTHAFWDWNVARELGGRHALGLAPNNPLV